MQFCKLGEAHVDTSKECRPEMGSAIRGSRGSKVGVNCPEHGYIYQCLGLDQTPENEMQSRSSPGKEAKLVLERNAKCAVL